MSGDLVDTTEMYLKAIYELEEEGVPPLRARLVERLGQSKPTVSETVARLERDGLLSIIGSRDIALSDKGRRHATTVMRKHRLAERLLLDVLGVDWKDIHEEACRWEHVISDGVEEKMAVLLNDAQSDPFGNPIPAEGALGPGNQAAASAGLVRGAEYLLSHPDGGEATVARIGEVLQTDPSLLSDLRDAGILPGGRVTITSLGGDSWEIAGGSGSVDFSAWLQNHLLLDI